MPFLPDRRSSRRSTVSDSGTSTGSRSSSVIGCRGRRSAGTAITSLTWAMPTTVSRLSRYTGKWDRPVARETLTTSSAVACSSRAVTWTRGVITLCAVSSERWMVRTNSSAVSASSAPSFAE